MARTIFNPKSLFSAAEDIFICNLIKKYYRNTYSYIKTLEKIVKHISGDNCIPYNLKFIIVQRALQILRREEKKSIFSKNKLNCYPETYYARCTGHKDTCIMRRRCRTELVTELWGLPSDTWFCDRCYTLVYEVIQVI